MPIDYRLVYPADAVEQAVPIGALSSPSLDPGAATYAHRVARACERAGIGNAAVIHVASVAVVRMAMRYGPLGKDGHAYHNQDHLLELLEDKLPALLAHAGLTTIGREALALFCACHDLRQREARRHDDEPIGANEAASLAETERLLDAAGLSGTALRMMLRFAIVGSTFAAGNDENVQSQGAFAHRLAGWLDGSQPGWRDDPIAAEAEHLARMAADIDTSNVASPYIDFAQSAVARGPCAGHCGIRRGLPRLPHRRAGTLCLRPAALRLARGPCHLRCPARRERGPRARDRTPTPRTLPCRFVAELGACRDQRLPRDRRAGALSPHPPPGKRKGRRSLAGPASCRCASDQGLNGRDQVRVQLSLSELLRKAPT
jgi:hypothetical protein